MHNEIKLLIYVNTSRVELVFLGVMQKGKKFWLMHFLA